MRRFVLLAVLLLFPLFAPAQTSQPAIEEQIRALIPKLADRADGKAAVEQLTALRDERVLHLFEHLTAGSVYDRNGKLVYVPALREEAGRGKVADVYDLFVALDAAGRPTAAPVETVAEADLKNKDFSPARPVRTAIRDALGVLGLKMDNADLRKAAAKDLGSRRQVDALADLRAIAANDPVNGVKQAAKESIALIVASGADDKATPQDKTDAIAALGDMTSIRALDLLKEQAAKPGNSPADAAAYTTSIKQIERHQSIANWMSNVFFGLSAGSIFVLLALGLAITFGLMGVINMAHGEMLMIGAVTTWACHEFLTQPIGHFQHAIIPPEWFNWYYVIAFPASFLMAATVGLVMELTIVRFLYKRPLDSLLATIGVSYILIQLVRNQFSDNMGMQKPTWAGGNWEIFQDVNLPYSRLFLIVLTAFCLLSVVGLFRYTKLGLMIRATVQNREMAQALGVNTRLVDMTTFAFGAGLAGLAGYGIVLTSNPSPELGQTFVVKSFLTVVVGGVGKLAGVVFSGLSLGFIEKLLEPITIITKPFKIFDATWSQVAALLAVMAFMQRRPGGMFPDKGRMADQASKTDAPFVANVTRTGDFALGAAFLFIGLILVPFLYGTGLMSLEFVNKLGYIFAFAICAIGLDLIWGYIGVLSLTQFLFFGIGGYCMGLYLINYGPMDGPHQNIPRALFVVMSAVSGAEPPFFLAWFKHFPAMLLLGLLLPGLLAMLIGLIMFRSRVKGVYFSILTQAITVAFWLVFQKNDMGLGGTNGVTNFDRILGFKLAASEFPKRLPEASWLRWLLSHDGVEYFKIAMTQTRFWLYIASCLSLATILLIAKLLVHSGFGRVLVAIRDDETRLRFVGYQTWAYKASAFAIAAIFAAIGGMLYVPQKGIITPQQLAAGASILVVAWVAIGGRGSLWGAVIGAIFVSLLYESLTSGAPDWFYSICDWLDFSARWRWYPNWLPDGSWVATLAKKFWGPDYWLIVLGLLFVLVPLLLPGGLMSFPQVIRKLIAKRRARPRTRGFEVSNSSVPAVEAP